MSKAAPLPAAEKKSTGYSRYVFGVLFAISFLNYLDRFVFTGAANVIAQRLNLSLDEIGYITSAFLIVYTLGTVPLGMWADREKRKNIVALCVAVWSVATIFGAFTVNFISLFIARMFLGIGEAGYFPAGTALLSDYYSREKRSRVMSRWNIAQFVGILGGFGIGGTLAGLFAEGWRVAFLIVGLPGLLLAFLAWRIREPRRNQADEEEGASELLQQASAVERETPHAVSFTTGGKNSFWRQCRELLRIKTLLVLIGMNIFAFFILGVCTTFLPIYLQQKDTFGFSSGLAGLYSGAVIVLAGLVGTTLGGYAADVLEKRFQGARVLVCGVSFLLGTPVFIVAITVRDQFTFSIFFFLTVVLLAVYNGPSTAASQDIVPSWLRASGMALSLLIAHMLGDAFSPALVGVLATALDPTHGLHFKQGIAGQELSFALLITCVPAFILAGVIGIFGARWMKGDVAIAEQADRQRSLQEQ